MCSYKTLKSQRRMGDIGNASSCRQLRNLSLPSHIPYSYFPLCKQKNKMWNFWFINCQFSNKNPHLLKSEYRLMATIQKHWESVEKLNTEKWVWSTIKGGNEIKWRCQGSVWDKRIQKYMVVIKDL